MTVQDWGVTYDELEPYYDKFEYLCGISGKAGNLKGQNQAGGNPFEGWRSRDYPNPPLDMVYGPTLFEAAAKETGHHPFPCPAANMSRRLYQSARRATGAVQLLRLLRKIRLRQLFQIQRADDDPAGADAQEEFRTAHAVRSVARQARQEGAQARKGVTYIDAQGEEWFQPAEMVILCAYATHNPRLLMLSGIGEQYDPRTGQGTVGKNYAYQIVSGVDVFFDDKIINPFIGAGALGIGIDNYNGDNFDHTGLGFIGGGYIACWNTNGRPIEN